MQHSLAINIDGEQYVLTHIQPTISWKVFLKLMKLIGTPLGAGLDSVDMSSIQKIADIELKLGSLIVEAAENIDTPDFQFVMNTLIGNASHNGQLLSGAYFDSHFLGRMGAIMKLLMEQVKFQYADFYTVVAGILGEKTTGQDSPSQAPQTSLGTSGESSSPKSRLSRK